MGTGKHVQVTLDLKKETELAWIMSDGDNNYSIPLSKIIEKHEISEDEFEIIIPEWLAMEKGII